MTSYRPPSELDFLGVLAPLRRGRGDPTLRVDSAGIVWLTGNTAAGAGTLALRRYAGGEIGAQAWGPGAAELIESVPALLGARDDSSGFAPRDDVLTRAVRRRPGLRLGASGRVWDALLPAVLEQKVTSVEARRSWRELCWRFGAAAPGPAPDGMRVPPTPAAIRAIADWEWHRAGVDLTRRSTLIRAARVAHRLARASELGGSAGRVLLRKVPGIGVWTAAEIAQRAWGDPDAVSFGDFHIPAMVGLALIGAPVDDDGMAELLAPYAPQRQRAVRYLGAIGVTRPRASPKHPIRNYRAM